MNNGISDFPDTKVWTMWDYTYSLVRGMMAPDARAANHGCQLCG